MISAQPEKPCDADVAVIWSWKQPRVINRQREAAKHVLVLERGFLQPRNQWVSLSWDGFNGRGSFPGAADGGARWDRHFGHMLKPWRETVGGNALLIGQVPGDAALFGQDIVAWTQDFSARLLGLGFQVTFRPHPLSPIPCPPGAILSVNSLATDLATAGFVVTYNSTTAVEAILAGVPAVVMDAGSVAYPMASHGLEEPLRYPDRTAWCHDLAWRQWTLGELADGSAWQHACRHIDGLSLAV